MWLYGGYIVICEGELFVYDNPDNEFDEQFYCTNCDYIGNEADHEPVIDEER